MICYGYARVSTKDQNELRQILNFTKLDITPENIFVDKISGSTFVRENYIRLKKKLTKGDCLYIKSIDRLGRNYSDIKKEWQELQAIGVDIIVVDMPLLNTTKYKDLMGTFISDLVLQVLSFVAEQELNHIKKRQAEGIEAARLQGKHLGRPVKNPENFHYVMERLLEGNISTKEAITLLNMPKSTFYYKRKKYIESKNNNKNK